MADPVAERPMLGRDLFGLVRALFYELGSHAIRSNRSVQKDGSELTQMQALSHVTIPELTGTANNLDIGSQVSLIRVSSDMSPQNITGIADGAANDPGEGRTLTIINVGSFNVGLIHEDSGSDVANRFKLGSGGGVTLLPDAGILLWYDKNDLRWRRRN